MPVDVQRVKLLLEELPRYELRRMVEEDLERNISTRKKEELVDALLDQPWTEDDKQRLSTRVSKIKQESSPLGFYIGVLDSYPDIKQFSQNIESSNPAQFDQDGRPIRSGYEISESDIDYLEFTKWNVKRETEFDRITGEAYDSEDISAVGVIIDTSENLVKVQTNKYGKAKSMQKYLRENGFKFNEVGHGSYLSNTAREKSKEFIDELQRKLGQINQEVDIDD